MASNLNKIMAILGGKFLCVIILLVSIVFRFMGILMKGERLTKILASVLSH